MIVFSNPVAGREAEYNDWYQNVHLKQVLALAGFKSAQRFRLALNMSQDRAAHPYLAIYEIETDDLAAVMQAVQNTAGTEQLVVSGALDTANAFPAIYEELAPALKK